MGALRRLAPDWSPTSRSPMDMMVHGWGSKPKPAEFLKLIYFNELR
jgi:hypothetical protein